MENDLHIEKAEQEVLDTISKQIKQSFKPFSRENPTVPGILVERGHVIGLFITRLSKNAEGEPLKTLPPTIDGLKQLSHLYLEGNELESLPDSIGNLSNLEVMDLSNNKISKLPESITKLTKLNRIDLSNTLMEYFPAWFIKFIDRNHLTVILRKNPEEKANEEWEDYWRHFSDYPY